MRRQAGEENLIIRKGRIVKSAGETANLNKPLPNRDSQRPAADSVSGATASSSTTASDASASNSLLPPNVPNSSDAVTGTESGGGKQH